MIIKREGTMKKSTKIWIGVGALVIVGAISSAAQGNKESDTTSGSRDNSTFIKDTTTTEADTGPSDELIGWASTNHNVTDEITSTLSDLSDSATSGDMSGTVQLCDDAWYNVDDWRSSLLPAPDDELNGELTSALDNLESGFEACKDYDFEGSSPYINAAGDDIARATARLRELQG